MRFKFAFCASAILFGMGIPFTLVTTHAKDSTPTVAPGFAYPPAQRGDVVDDYHGVKVADPYRWLEQLDAPDTRAWVTAEAQLTDSYLEKIPVRQALKERLTKLFDFERFGMPFHEGSRYFYGHNSGLQPQSVLYTTIGLNGKPGVALDPNILSTNGSLAV